METTDTELLKRYRQGDFEAFTEIYERYADALLGFLTRMCGSYEDARDTLQDSLLAVFKNLQTFRGDCSLKNWIYKIAVRNCLKNRKKRGKETLLRENPDHPFPLGDRLPTGDDPALSAGAAGRSEDPERLAINGEIYRHIAEEVASLPYIYRIVLVLRDFEGFSGQEVSEILGIKETTAKVRLHRARLSLRDRLRKRYAAPGTKAGEWLRQPQKG
jgi:RNA polymerase sigma-70 factor (ECF subfamily)